MFVSVIIPAYNEEGRLKDTVEKISRYLIGKQFDCEIIIVDDGSDDETYSVAVDFAKGSPCQMTVLRNDINRGKGYSVRRGMLESHGDFVVFTDADLSTPIEEMDQFLNYIHKGYDIVIGSRSVRGADVKIRQPWFRQTMGKIFNLFVKLLLLKDFNDTQCGFKLLKGDIAREIARKMKIDGFCFDVELLYIAKQKGLKIKEAGVVWCNSPQSKVKVVNSSANMFLDLIKIKLSQK